MNKIIVCISGAAAAYNMPMYLKGYRDLHPEDELICIVSASAKQFISVPLLSPFCSSLLFCGESDPRAQHVILSQNNPIVVLCPATADRIARVAAGFAMDLMDLVLLISGNRSLIFPSMNPAMRRSIAVENNLTTLKKRGYEIYEEQREGVILATNEKTVQPSMPTYEEWINIIERNVKQRTHE